jgi:hypothetical protein
MIEALRPRSRHTEPPCRCNRAPSSLIAAFHSWRLTFRSAACRTRAFRSSRLRRASLRAVQLEVELGGYLGRAEIAEPLEIAIDLHGDRSQSEVGRGLGMRHVSMITRLGTVFEDAP